MPMFYDEKDIVYTLISAEPKACARIRGSDAYPELWGEVCFYPFGKGSLAAVYASGLPTNDETCSTTFFGFHIHEGGSCTGNATDPFADTGAHLNPQKRPHPCHLGDLPPLAGSHGTALAVFYMGAFVPEDMAGHTVIIHEKPDDFTTQPSGNSGSKIGCGEIKVL